MIINKNVLTHSLSRIIALCLLIQILISWKLWIPLNRSFPIVSAFRDLDFAIGITGDILLTITILIALLLVILKKYVRPSIIVTLSCIVLLVLEDITRLQPWIYSQIILLIILSQSKNNGTKHIVNAVLILVSLVYIWSGIQKLNLGFITQTFPWLISTFGIDVQSSLYPSYPILYYTFILVPFYEFTIGLFLLFSKTRKAGILMGIIMHVFILLSLGPLGHFWNIVVWPWNIALIICLALFYKLNEPIKLFYGLNISKAIWIVLIIFGIMPVLNFVGYWDKPLSGSLYSGTDSSIAFYFNTKDIPEFEKLNLKTEIIQKSDSDNQTFKLDFMYWSMSDIQVPYYHSQRYFQRYGQKICAKCKYLQASGIEVTNRTNFTNTISLSKYSCIDLVRKPE